MALYEFTDEMSVGVPSMDLHHKKLFDIINKLHEAMKEGKGGKVISKTINDLGDYTKYHFEEEERIMESVNYPGLPAQKSAHRALIAKIAEFQQRAEDGMAIFVVIEVVNTAVDWLKSHILKMDKEYSEIMKANGIR